MKKKIAVTTLFLSMNTYAASIQDVAFLSGCWNGQDGDMTTTENWLPPTANLMQGIAQTKNAQNEVVRYEFLKIESKLDGSLVFTPFIDGEKLSDFVYDAKLSGVSKAAFTNPKNDFPKVISYSLAQPNRTQLDIRLEGHDQNNAPMVIEFPLYKVSCEQ